MMAIVPSEADGFSSVLVGKLALHSMSCMCLIPLARNQWIPVQCNGASPRQPLLSTSYAAPAEENKEKVRFTQDLIYST